MISVATEKVYEPEDIELMIKDNIKRGRDKIEYRKTQYYNVPCSFDIETTSFYEHGEKRACMYAWVFGLNDAVMLGRTWEELEHVLNVCVEKLYLNAKRRLIIYVHNLAYEFAFIAHRFDWDTVFSIDTRKPLYARTVDGIEFRCSYRLSGYNLETVGNNLVNHDIRKKTGYLDYERPRHSETPLTPKECEYIVNDARVVMAYIAERIDADGNIAKIPLTKTGYVRKHCKSKCLSISHRERTGNEYRKIMKELTIEPDEYLILKKAFQGGFTHANPFYTNNTLFHIGSKDFTSSYPTVMIAEQFPMGKGERVMINSKEEFERNILLYACIFTVEIFNLHSKIMFENPLSSSHCEELEESVLNNGRVVSAQHLITVCTEIDWSVYKKCYSWSDAKIHELWRYRRDYLPKPFIESILDLYVTKTSLKGVAGKETEYLHAKENLNSCYGMCVTDINKDLITYEYDDGIGTYDWGIEKKDTETNIERYNGNPQRFLYYPWGLYVTAYARRNLWSGILHLGTDYVYADTDSVKYLNPETHEDYFNRYNNWITARLKTALEHHGISPERAEPVTKDGKKKPLGIWDDEGILQAFKTLGAKRYLYMKDYNIKITVAGSHKQKTAEFLEKNAGKYGAFSAFTNLMSVPPDYSGRTSMQYIDGETRGWIKDYTGVWSEYNEKTSAHMEKTGYNLDIAQSYIDYFTGIQATEV